MAFSVQMPALGESVTEGTVTRWLKQEGDTVELDEPLVEVSTDKVDTEIPSPAAGVLTKIIAQEDDTVPQHMRVGKAVRQHDGRARAVALFVDRDAHAVGAVDELLGYLLYCRHRTSATRDLLCPPGLPVATP